MSVLYLMLFWLGGLAAGAFLLIPPLIIVFFAIPFTFKLKRLGVIDSLVPARRYVISLLILLTVLAALTWATWTFVPTYFMAYSIGIAITLVLGLGRCGTNAANVAEYAQANRGYLASDWESRLAEIGGRS